MKNKIMSLESYSRRDNLIIHGIKKTANETAVSCSRAVKSIFVESLGLEQETVSSMVFSRCHRLPQGKSVKSAPAIIIRFRSYADRTLVWESKTRLKGTGFILSENFDSDTAYNRNKLYPIFKKAGSVSEKVSLKGDQLFIDGSQYGVESLDKLQRVSIQVQ